jgi:two-component system response regulator
MDQRSKTILPVEDNDAKLTLRAFKRNNILNPIVVARNGVEALDIMFARGAYAECAGKPLQAPPECGAA